MTLREFTDKYAPLPQSMEDYWRKVFPTNLRWRQFEVEAGYYKGWILSPWHRWVEPVTDEVLEEQWERIHVGEVIDTEWRKVSVY